MSPRITHSKVSGKPNPTDASKVGGEDWDADHVIDGLTIGTDVQAHDTTLDALAAFDSNGIMVQYGTDQFTARTLTGTANEITVANGAGASGNPTISLPSALTFTGKTVTGGTFNETRLGNLYSSLSNPASTYVNETIADNTVTVHNLLNAELDVTPGDWVWLLGLRHIMSGSTGRGTLFIESEVSTAPTTYLPFSGVQGRLQARTDGALSSLYGLNYYTKLLAGATNWLNVTSGEITIEARSGSSVDYKTGLQIVLGALDEVQGTTHDALLALGSTALAPGAGKGAKHAILVGDMHGWQPLDTANGVVLGTTGTATIKHFLDAGSYTVTGALLKGSGHIAVTASGADFTGIQSGDLGVGRGVGEGWVYYGTGGGQYIGFDGTRYLAMGGAPVKFRLGTPGIVSGALELSGSTSGYATIAPPSVAGSATWSLQNATDTFVGRDTTDTLTNKSMSGSSNTFTNIPGSAITGAALTRTNDTNVTLTLGGSPTTALLNAASITVGWSGTLAASRGGFGADVSAQSGVPLFATGVPTFTSTTGSGNFVRATSPTLVTPALGTPSSGTLSSCTGLPVSTGISGLGTGVATALAVNVGSAGALVTFNGALGTPSSATLTNATGLPISTGVSGLGTGVAAFLATPSSANLAAAVTDETGSGALVFGTSPTFTTQITSPSVIGGTGASSTLTLLATTGVGAGSEHVYIKGGSNGAITLADFSSSQSYLYGLVTTQGGSAGLGFADRLTTGTTYHYRQSGIFAIYDTAYSGGADMLTMNTSTGDATFAGNVQAPNLYMSNASFIARSKATLTNAAAAATGTLTNAPAAGNPTKWIAIDDNGTTRYIPAW